MIEIPLSFSAVRHPTTATTRPDQMRSTNPPRPDAIHKPHTRNSYAADDMRDAVLEAVDSGDVAHRRRTRTPA